VPQQPGVPQQPVVPPGQAPVPGETPPAPPSAPVEVPGRANETPKQPGPANPFKPAPKK
jgi:hypothetical protein